MPLATLTARALALVVPPLCVSCRGPLPAADAPALCPACLRALPWLGPDVCRRCGLLAHGGRRCRERDGPLASAWAPLAHEGPARDLLHALKFRGALPVLDLMAAQVATNLPVWARGGATVVVAVPAAAARRRRRGFDPAGDLAAGVAARLGLPLRPALQRAGGPRQLGAGRAERLATGRLRVGVTAPLGAERVLLVDDVHTTGATLRACAEALLAAGVAQVNAVTYTRAS